MDIGVRVNNNMMTFNIKINSILVFVFVFAEQTIAFSSRSFIATRHFACSSSKTSCNLFLKHRSLNANGSVRRQSVVDDIENTHNEEQLSGSTSTTSSSGSTSRRTKRRKDPTTAVDEQSSMMNSNQIQEEIKQQQQQQQQQLKPREASRVTMAVKDIRELTLQPGQTIADIETSESSNSASSFISSMKSKFSSSTSDVPSKKRIENRLPTAVTGEDNNNADYESMDPIQRMQFDIQEMKEKEKDDDSLNKKSENDNSIGSRVRGVISTIVTVDFFIVCAFLLWFLAGVFASYILKDDTIQILFNSNFQTFVQPALGILMIASVTDGILNQEKDE